MISAEQILKSINQIFEAGIAITGLSLFIRSLSFNLKDRVSRSFAIVLACVVVIFSGEAISGAVGEPLSIEFWLKFQWLGILFLPAALQHFSDALLATTGRPSRGRRRIIVLGSYIFSGILVASLILGFLLGPVTFPEIGYPHPTPTILSAAFSIYYLGSTVIASFGIWRAYRRTKLKVSRRRISYLLVGMIFLAIGAYPYMHIGSSFAQHFSTFFILLVIFGNVGIFLCLLLMAYAVAFFGVSWPDRIVRSRLLKWVFRGPITVFVMLFLLTMTYQIGEYFEADFTVAIPIVSVISVMLAEHLITLIYPFIDRWLLHYGDDGYFYMLQSLSERLITMGDLRQFLETILAAVCDQFQVSTGFVAALVDEGWEIVVHAGDFERIQFGDLGVGLLEKAKSNGGPEVFGWGDFWFYPLFSSELNEIIGLMGVLQRPDHTLDEELSESIRILGKRAAMALEDRRLQRKVIKGLEELGPKVELIQRLRAAFRFDQSVVLNDLNEFESTSNISAWVKDALSHYWGGPKLTESPLLDLQVVQEALNEHEGNPSNALRAVLKSAVDQVKPAGDRKFTPEWILYNILEMKFLEGRKVREIARRLALSEADLYRKQRVAIEAVAQTIIEMELKARES